VVIFLKWNLIIQNIVSLSVTITPLVVLSSIFWIIYYVKKDYRLISVVKLFCFSTSLFVYIITNFNAIFINDDLTALESKMNLKINILAGLLSLIFLCFLFLDVPSRNLPHTLIFTGLLTSVFLIGVSVWDLYYETEKLFLFNQGDAGEWYVRFTVPLLIMVSMIIISIFSGLLTITRSRTMIEFAPSHSRIYYPTQISIAFFTIGVLLIVVLIAFRDEIDANVADLIDFMSTSVLLLGIVMMLLDIFANPITSLFFRRGPRFLLIQKLVAWALFCNTDNGPVLYRSELSILEQKHIPPEKILQFGLQSIMFSQTDNKIIESVGITPFLGDDEIICISFTFSLLDESISDQRLNHQALSILIIFIPSFILSAFSHPIGRLNQLNEILIRNRQDTKNIEEFGQEENLEQLVYAILNELF
jgi:hypothetical protein